VLERGEVWQVDFGVTQKIRPALIISVPFGDADRALVGVIPHTTARRGSQFEVTVPVSFFGWRSVPRARHPSPAAQVFSASARRLDPGATSHGRTRLASLGGN
jgi:hypothetical protein